MRRPRDLPDSGGDGLCRANAYWVQAHVDSRIVDGLLDEPTPRQYRRVAAWLRRVADWYEWLAEKQRAKRCVSRTAAKTAAVPD